MISFPVFPVFRFDVPEKWMPANPHHHLSKPGFPVFTGFVHTPPLRVGARMTPRGFLETMRAKGICFFAQDGRLRWFASSSPNTDDLATARALKVELLGLLRDTTLEAQCAGVDPEEAEYLRQERAAILEHEAGLSSAEAELRAGLYQNTLERT
jgi:hypothetical protein